MTSQIRTGRVNLLMLFVLMATIGASFLIVGIGEANSHIVVNSPEDEAKNDGQCTLREAIDSVNNNKDSGKKIGECKIGSSPDTIEIPAGTYTLTKSDSGNEDSGSTGDLDIRNNVTIIGAGADTTVINTVAGFQDRIFHVLSGELSISGVTLSGGNVKDDGGSIYNLGTLNLNNVSIDNNYAGNVGGGIYNAGSVNVTNSTISGNTAEVAGGGIYNAGDASLVNVTISGNHMSTSSEDIVGGGGFVNASGNANFTNVTIAENGTNAPEGSGGNLRSTGGSLLIKNTLIANPLADGNCYGTIISLGNNLSSDGSCGLSPSTDIVTFNAGLGALRDNGGETLTHALISGSPAIDAGETLEYPPTDQRGVSRSFGVSFDIGAYESTTSGNVSWVNAQEITPEETPLDVYIEQPGLSRWFRFEVHPGQQIVVTLTDLPGNYDLTLYKDIVQAYMDITNAVDLPKLDAEFAPDAFSPDAFSPDAFSPDAFSPDAFSPDAFSPDAFSPDAFSPDAFSPDAFSPDAFSPDAFSPDAFSPDAFSPDAFSPDAFSPDAFSPDAFSPDAFSSAQTRSLIAVSAFEGNASEGILINTWDNTGYFYIRVRGRNGLSVEDGFAVMTLAKDIGQCEAVREDNLPPSSILPNSPEAGKNYSTIVLWDSTRLIGAGEQFLDPVDDQVEIDNLKTKLTQFASLASVNGVVVDVSLDNRVQSAKAQADSNRECPYAVNLWADAIEDIVDGYWEHYPFEYVVLVGNDDAIPFFREPDHAMLANEKNYVPPVRDSTTSQASLKLGFVLSQDRYGSPFEVSLKESELPIPGLAVGRLVETTSEITNMLDAYALTNNGVVNTPISTLVTGYDFLADSSEAIRDELNFGSGFSADELISARDLAPEESWTADDLKTLLLGDPNGHDLIYLAGHFSANSALAADYVSRLLTTDLLASNVDLENSIIFSPGCHSGYNIVDPHDVPGVTRAPDWAQAFAQKGATLIAGTGYQYGDTDFIEYSERLYLEFSRQLRVGSGPVPIGKALAEAKRIYLAETPQMRGIHEKAYLEATLFGLPMLSVDLPQGRITEPGDASAISSTSAFATNPGATLGLKYADLPINADNNNIDLTLETRTLEEVEIVNGVPEITLYQATYLSGSDGVVANPVEPVLPLETFNVTVPYSLTRGVGFRGGSYTDHSEVIPLTGAATTEVRGVHTPFLTDIYFPVRFWGLNYFDNLAVGGGNTTRLNVTPAQFISDSSDITKGTLREYTSLDFRLYYSDNFATYTGGSVPALSGPPSIANITSTINGDQVDFQVTVLGNPAAGIQEVWVTYTATTGSFYGEWQSLNLVQNTDNTLVWEEKLPLNGTDPDNVRFMVQAVNGVGMVSASTNLGLAYIPGVDPALREPTELTLNVSETSAPYGTKPTFSATLVHASLSGDVPLEGERVLFRLGAQTRLGITDPNGIASIEFPILGLPDDPLNANDDYELKASFPGNAIYDSATTSVDYNITKQTTSITLDPNPELASASDESIMVASLTDTAENPRLLAERTVFFILTDNESGDIYEEAVITDYAGRANLGDLPLSSGTYTVDVFFSGTVPLQAGAITLNDDRYEPTLFEDGLLTLNEPPTADDDSYTTDEDTKLTIGALAGILANDMDTDNYPDPLSPQLVEGPLNGTLSLGVNLDGSFEYTPNENFNGEDSFTYKASDGLQESNIATVTLTINPVNDPPVVGAATVVTDEDTPTTITLIGSDVDEDDLTFVIVSGPSNGVLAEISNGTFTYSPNQDFNGLDSFTYIANDGAEDSNVATVTLTIYAVNDPPIAQDDNFGTSAGVELIVAAPGVLANDSDADDVSLLAELLTSPDTFVTLNSDGSFTYTPAPGFSGVYAFTYAAYDREGYATGFKYSEPATVSIHVNGAPTCAEATPSVSKLWPPNGEFYTVEILGVVDPEGDKFTILITSVYQDEVIGREADAIISPDLTTADVRAERDGNGDGRVYHISFIVTDEFGAFCEGTVRVPVAPHDNSGKVDAIDGGPIHDSTVPTPE